LDTLSSTIDPTINRYLKILKCLTAGPNESGRNIIYFSTKLCQELKFELIYYTSPQPCPSPRDGPDQTTSYISLQNSTALEFILHNL
jgi:hypothetical protein